MVDPKSKMFTVTLEIESRSYEMVVKMIEKLINDQRTISFRIDEQKEN